MARVPKQLGPLLFEAEIESDVAAPRVAALDAEGRRYIARVISTALAVPDELVATLESDARAAAALTDARLAAPELFGTDPCFTAAPDPGGSTLVWLMAEREGAWPLEEAASVALDVADGLTVAHGAGVVHGSVGTGAVLVSAEGRALLTDFGIASLAVRLSNKHSVALESAAAQLTPELLEGAPATAASDVFSLGAILYRLVGGRYPFEGLNPVAMSVKMRMGKYDPLSQLAPSAPEPLVALVHRMLKTDSSQRPSAEEVARELALHAPPEPRRHELMRARLPAADENRSAARASLPPPGASLPPPGASLPPPGASLPPPGASLPPPGASLPPPGASLSPPGASLPPSSASLPPPGASLPPPTASAPPTSGFGPPPTSGFGPPPTSGFGGPPAPRGREAQPTMADGMPAFAPPAESAAEAWSFDGEATEHEIVAPPDDERLDGEVTEHEVALPRDARFPTAPMHASTPPPGVRASEQPLRGLPTVGFEAQHPWQQRSAEQPASPLMQALPWLIWGGVAVAAFVLLAVTALVAVFLAS